MRHDLMTDTSTDELTNAVAAELFHRLNTTLAGRKFDRQLVQDVETIIHDTRVTARLRGGVKFPELAVVCLPKQRAIELVNRDLDNQGIERFIRRLAVKYPAITAVEIASAVKEAFPEYRPQIMLPGIA